MLVRKHPTNLKLQKHYVNVGENSLVFILIDKTVFQVSNNNVHVVLSLLVLKTLSNISDGRHIAYGCSPGKGKVI